MRSQKIIKNLAIILLIGCAILLAIDIFKEIKINMDFAKMQSSERISSTNVGDEIKYEPTDYLITNKDEALEEIKNITLELKDEYVNSENNENLFEIGNIHKIENLFYKYESYMIVKYKLFNFVEELPKFYSNVKGYSDSQLKTYYDEKNDYVETYFGITDSDEFIKFAKSLNFLENSKIDVVYVDIATIRLDYDNDRLTFNINFEMTDGKVGTCSVISDYYKSSDNQIKPYVKITK